METPSQLTEKEPTTTSESKVQHDVYLEYVKGKMAMEQDKNLEYVKYVTRIVNWIIKQYEKCSRDNLLVYPEDVFCNPLCGSIDVLIPLMVAEQYDKRYNSILCTHNVFADWDRIHQCKSVKLEMSLSDLFKGIRIGCMDPSEIQKVELLVRDTLGDSDPYFVVKAIDNPKSSYIQFFDFPIAHKELYMQWKVNFYTTSIFTEDEHPVQVDYFVCSQELRVKLFTMRPIWNTLL